MRAALVPRALLSSSLRSSSTRAVVCVLRAAGCLRGVVVRVKARVKVNCASGGPGSENGGGHGRRAVGLCLRSGGWGPVGVFSSPVPGGNQEPAGGATGGGAVWLSHGVVFAGCAPGRTLIGLRRPGEENTPTSAGNIALRSTRNPPHPAPDVKYCPKRRRHPHAGQARYENEHGRPRVPRKTLKLSFPEPPETASFVSAPR